MRKDWEGRGPQGAAFSSISPLHNVCSAGSRHPPPASPFWRLTVNGGAILGPSARRVVSAVMKL